MRKFGKNGGRSYQKKTKQKNSYYSSDTKASSGRTDAKVQICLQTQTSCRLETDMDDCVAAVTAVVAAYRRRKQRIKNNSRLALVLRLLDEEDALVSRENICSLSNVRRTAVLLTSSVQIRCCWRPLAQTVLFAWHVAAFGLHSCSFVVL